jgi:hypothetical protein
MAQLTRANFDQVVNSGEDTWLVHFYSRERGGAEAAVSADTETEGTIKKSSPSSSAEEKRVSRLWNELALKLNGIMSVGAYDIEGDVALAASLGLTLEQLAEQPVVRLYPGMCVASLRDSVHGVCREGREHRGDPIDYSGAVELDALETYALTLVAPAEAGVEVYEAGEQSMTAKLPRGSVTGVGVRARRLLHEGVQALR